MKYLASHEKAEHGSFAFPLQLYYVDDTHSRYEMPFHWHIEHEIIKVNEGVLKLYIEGEPYFLQKGECALISGGSIHGASPDKCVYECIVFDLERFFPKDCTAGQYITKLINSGIKFEGFFEKESKETCFIEDIFDKVHRADYGYEISTVGLLWQLFGYMVGEKRYKTAQISSAKSGKQSHIIKRVLGYVRENYHQSITLEDLSGIANLDSKYFCRIFKQVTGKSPIDYLNYYRIECASEILCATDESITEIALSCGFSDVSYFIRLFRRQKGVTPRKYRTLYKSIEF